MFLIDVVHSTATRLQLDLGLTCTNALAMFQRLARCLKMRTNRGTMSEDGHDTTETSCQNFIATQCSLDTQSGRYCLAAREVDARAFQSIRDLPQQSLAAHWGTISYVQTVDTATDGCTLAQRRRRLVIASQHEHHFFYVGYVAFVRGGAYSYF